MHPAAQWRQLLAEDYEQLFVAINENCKHQNPELKSCAFAALEAFLREVCAAPSPPPSDFAQVSAYIMDHEAASERTRAMFKFLFQNFRSVLDAKV